MMITHACTIWALGCVLCCCMVLLKILMVHIAAASINITEMAANWTTTLCGFQRLRLFGFSLLIFSVSPQGSLHNTAFRFYLLATRLCCGIRQFYMRTCFILRRVSYLWLFFIATCGCHYTQLSSMTYDGLSHTIKNTSCITTKNIYSNSLLGVETVYIRSSTHTNILLKKRSFLIEGESFFSIWWAHRL